MEKFAVDLEKVLDEFEFCEEHEERVALSVNNSQCLPYISHPPAQNRPLLPSYTRPPFEPINLADADFAASPPRTLQNLNDCPNLIENNLTKSQSLGNCISEVTEKYTQTNNVKTNSAKNKNDARVNYSFEVPGPSLHPHKRTPSVSSGESISDSCSEGETSSLSEEVPDLLDCFSLVNSSNRNNDNFLTDYEGAPCLLPDVTTSVSTGRSNETDNQNCTDRAAVHSIHLRSARNSVQPAFLPVSNSSCVADNQNVRRVRTSDLPIVYPPGLPVNCDNSDNQRFNCSVLDLVTNNVPNNQFSNDSDDNSEIYEKLDYIVVNDIELGKRLAADSPTESIVAEEEIGHINRTEELNRVTNNERIFNNIPGSINDLESFNECNRDDDEESLNDRNEVSLPVLATQDNFLPSSNSECNFNSQNENRIPIDLENNRNEFVENLDIDSGENNIIDDIVGFKLDNEANDETDSVIEERLKELEELEKSYDFNCSLENNNTISIEKNCSEESKTENSIVEEVSSLNITQSLSSFVPYGNIVNEYVHSSKRDIEYGDSRIGNVTDEAKLLQSKETLISEANLKSDKNINVLVNSNENLDLSSENLSIINKNKLHSCIQQDNVEITSSKNLIIDNVGYISNNDIDKLNSFMNDISGEYQNNQNFNISKAREEENTLNSILKEENSISCNNICKTDDSIDENHQNGVYDNLLDSSKDNQGSETSELSSSIESSSISDTSETIMGNSMEKNASDDLTNSVSVVASNSDRQRTIDYSTVTDDVTNITLKKQPNSSYENRDIPDSVVDTNDSETVCISRPNSLNLQGKLTAQTGSNTETCAGPSSSVSPSQTLSPTSPVSIEGEPYQCSLAKTASLNEPILEPKSDTQIGKVAPKWVPDEDALFCMQCENKFTLVKRRHHCRACGKVLCSKCCCMKAKLDFLKEESRVCVVCYNMLEIANNEPKSTVKRQPNPNNPMEYCSTIPPLQQMGSRLNQPPPSVLVPVLKREGKAKSEVVKQVMFSDGIRPGGDLTELDGSGEPQLPVRRSGRVTKRVGTPPGGVASGNGKCNGIFRSISGRNPLDPITQSFIPGSGNDYPPIVERVQGETVYSPFESKSIEISDIKPVKFAINHNLFVFVKRVILDCCVNKECWCISSCGLSCVGQDEVIFALETLPSETLPPKSVFFFINALYVEASKGNTVTEMSFSPCTFDSKDHGGFLFIRSTYQCTTNLILPKPPYLVALLINKWETPWARLFPLRLVLRLGAEYRYYPCPLVSVRNRQPLYTEVGNTIINLLADFRKYSYTLATVRGLVIHMEDRQTTILVPRNRYDQVVRALNNSNDSVLALGANLSLSADSHLVCIQSQDHEGTYHTQAINIHNKPRKVTGASFIVFNGALKASYGLSGKSSIVEDGLMVQVPSDTMIALRDSLRGMKDYTIMCGPQSEESVTIKWTADDINFNIGVKSCIDGRPLDGVPSMRVHNGTDYLSNQRIIRWTEVFILKNEEGSGSGDPVDISRLAESIAKATCNALVPFLDLLTNANLTTLAVRANIHPDNVGYEAGSNCEKLPPIYMNSLDNELVVVVHQAAITCQDSPCTLELVFHIMES